MVPPKKEWLFVNTGIWNGENWELEQEAHWKKQEAIAREERRAVRRKKRRRKMWGDLFLTFLFVLGCLGIGYWAIGQQGAGGNGQSVFAQALAGKDLSGEEADTLLLVNRWNPLPGGYVPDLVEIPGGEKVAKEAYAPLMEMLQQAEAEGLGPQVVSGWRTQEKQQSLYDNKIGEYLSQGYSQKDAVAAAEEWVAKPGTSEHQLGLAVDINGNSYDIYTWLQENSWRYGFIFRYPGDKQSLTGVAEEVWHYRYVGKKAAEMIHSQELCLEEYAEEQKRRKALEIHFQRLF